MEFTNEADSLSFDSVNDNINEPFDWNNEKCNILGYYSNFCRHNFLDINPPKIEIGNSTNSYSYSNCYDFDSVEKKTLKEDITKNPEGITEISEGIKNKIFRISKEEKRKKFGRKKGREIDSENDDNTHTKYAHDNINRKIQVHFLNFLIFFINEILMSFKTKKKFLNIDYKNKKVVTKNNVENLKISEIGQILRQDISTKYRKLYQIDKNINNKVYLEVIKNENINKILSETYINIFRNIYYKNKKDLNDYGLNIKLSKNVKTFEDLLKKHNQDSKYIKKIKDLVKEIYLPRKLFIHN